MLSDIFRSLLVFSHLMFFSGAICMVLWADVSIIVKGQTKAVLESITRWVVILFALLWATGLLICCIDTRFEPAVILGNSKIVLKIVCVLVLTVNGLLLHFVGFKILSTDGRLSFGQVRILCVSGALSTTNWLLAGFVGSANFLTQLSVSYLLTEYFIVIIAACICGLLLVKPVQNRLNTFREPFSFYRT